MEFRDMQRNTYAPFLLKKQKQKTKNKKKLPPITVLAIHEDLAQKLSAEGLGLIWA
jgi:hypothetical protein